jgi:hypothetical protein
MRSIFATLAVGCTIALSAATPAKAHAHLQRWYHNGYFQHHQFGRYLVQRHIRISRRLNHRHWAHRLDRPDRFLLSRKRHQTAALTVSGERAVLPQPCRVAASMGGPCGCWAAYVLLGRLDHVWHGINLWLANDWLRFPRAEPSLAAAVVWPGRHVAPIVPGSYRNGTVVVRDSWATHRVRTAGLVFVQPPMQRVPRRLIAWPSSVPL